MALLISGAAFAAMSAAYIYGGYQLADYAQSNKPVALGLSVAGYVAGNAILLHFLKSEPYGAMMILSALAVLIGNTAVSALAFGETYTVMQSVGIGLAGLAIILIGGGGDGGSAVAA